MSSRIALAVALAALGVLTSVPASADAAWQVGWPGQAYSYDGAHASGGDALLVMRVRDGRSQNWPGVRWDALIQRPAPGRAVCIRYEAYWNSVRGASRTLWLRPNVWPVDPVNPPKPELDLMETLYAGKSNAYSHPPSGVWEPSRLLAELSAAPGVWHPFVFKLTQDRVHGSLWSPGGGGFSGPMWWPAGGYALVAGQWLIRPETQPDWPGDYKAQAGDHADAVQWIRNTHVSECAA